MRATIITIIFIVIVIIGQGQTEENHPFQLPYNNFNIEFLGNVYILGSINYERIIFHRNKMYLSGRWGFSYLQRDPNHQFLIFPTLINFIYNINKVLSFEVGAGTTLFIQSSSEEYDNGIDPVLTGFAGIRLTKINNFKGFCFRIGFTPFYDFLENGPNYFIAKTIIPWGGFSLGYSFGKN